MDGDCKASSAQAGTRRPSLEEDHSAQLGTEHDHAATRVEPLFEADGDPSVPPSASTHEHGPVGPDTRSAKDKRLPILLSIGCTGCIALVLGSALTVIALAFLVFLWTGEGPLPGGEQAFRIWRDIMLNGQIAQAVTLTSLILRVVSASQATICTSMVAALLLERRKIPLSCVARISAMRNVNGGPRDLLQIILSQLRGLAIHPESVLLSVLFISAVGMQFSSTILVSDFDEASLIGYPNLTRINIATSEMIPEVGDTLWSNKEIDSAMTIFGERDGPAPTLNDYGVLDTGTKQRAFLPFQKADRVRLQHFEGPVFMMNSRVSCLRPSMIATLAYDQTEVLIEGEILYDNAFRQAQLEPEPNCFVKNGIELCLLERFSCRISALRDSNNSLKWSSDLCHLKLGSTAGAVGPSWDSVNNPLNFTSGSWPHLVFTTNAPITFFRELSEPLKLGNSMPYKEWSVYELRRGMSVNASLCFSGLRPSISQMKMTGNTKLREPELTWNSTTYSFDVDDLQTFLGADPVHKSIDERGLLAITGDMHDPAPPSNFDVSAKAVKEMIRSSFSNLVGATIAAFLRFPGGIQMCDHCDGGGHRALASMATVFQQIINTSGVAAATAIDAYLIMLSRSRYYTILPRFNVPGYVNVTFSEQGLLPRHRMGLIVVLILATVNLVSVWSITAQYVKYSRYTRAGDFWYSISQLVSEETWPILQQSNEMRDRDVSRALGENARLVRVGRSADTGRIEIIRCDAQGDIARE